MTRGLVGKRSSTGGSSPAATRSASMGDSLYCVSCAATMPNNPKSMRNINQSDKRYFMLLAPKFLMFDLSLKRSQAGYVSVGTVLSLKWDEIRIFGFTA